jgi:hypothetical protein
MNINEMKVKAYNEITELAWSEDNAETVLQRILGVLYSVEQTMDHRSGELEDWVAMAGSFNDYSGPY